MRRFWDGVRVCERVIMADQMTFEQLRPYMQQKYAAVFAAGFALPSQVNPFLDVPVGEPLHKVVRFMAKIVANHIGGLLILASVRLRYREIIADALTRGRNAVAIWQDLYGACSHPRDTPRESLHQRGS